MTMELKWLGGKNTAIKQTRLRSHEETNTKTRIHQQPFYGFMSYVIFLDSCYIHDSITTKLDDKFCN